MKHSILQCASSEVLITIAQHIALDWGKVLIERQNKKFKMFTEDESFDDLSEDEKKMACRVLECSKHNIISFLYDCRPNDLDRFVEDMDDFDLKILASFLAYELNRIAGLLGLNDTYDNINNVVYNNDLVADCY